jgi:hypothetical protein
LPILSLICFLLGRSGNLTMKLPTLMFSAILAACATLASGAAQGETVFSLDGRTAEMASPASMATTFSAAPGAGVASFRLDGYGSLDGDSYWRDVFTLSLNGAAILSGAWDLGGGSPGADLVYLAPTQSRIAPVSGAYFQGGHVDFVVPLTLSAGLNTLTFAYSSPSRAGPEGIANEGWGLENVRVTDSVAGAVPEPSAWLLLITGFGVIGATLRHNRSRELPIEI